MPVCLRWYIGCPGRDANNNVLVAYDRGLDFSGSLQGAFGVGGLLARTDIKGTLFYHSDGIGNVTALFDKYQTLEARYLTDPMETPLANGGRMPTSIAIAISQKNIAG